MPKIQIDVTEEEHELYVIANRIEELKKEVKTLSDQRTVLIQKLYEDGHQQSHIARLAKLTSGRISQIVTGYYDKK